MFLERWNSLWRFVKAFAADKPMIHASISSAVSLSPLLLTSMRKFENLVNTLVSCDSLMLSHREREKSRSRSP
jgi:hypothetical protein